MLNATKNTSLATAMVGSFPKPTWFTQNLHGRPFKVAMGDSTYREQYLDAVACYLSEQERAGLDVLTDGDTRFDLEVGGRSWFFYTIERLNGVSGFKDKSHFLEYGDFKPGHILYEVQEAYHPPAVTGKITRGPLHFTAIWKTAQKMSSRPVKFGTISATCLPMMLWNEHYANDHEMIWDLVCAQNEELRITSRAARSRRRARTSSSSTRKRSTAKSRASRPRSGRTPAGGTRISRASTGSARATRRPCRTCSRSTPT
jgi:5-methyltetrahydropteroyltriglutamate--homocysteine methyltransferase